MLKTINQCTKQIIKMIKNKKGMGLKGRIGHDLGCQSEWAHGPRKLKAQIKNQCRQDSKKIGHGNPNLMASGYLHQRKKRKSV